MKHFGVLLLCIAFVTLSGCATGILRPGIADHSRVRSEFKEKINADQSSELTITNDLSGDAATQRTVAYTGPTEAVAPDGSTYVASPWQLTDGVNAEITSPQALAVAQGYQSLLTQLPSEIAPLVGQILSVANTPANVVPGVPDMRAQIIKSLLSGFFSKLGGGVVTP